MKRFTSILILLLCVTKSVWGTELYESENFSLGLQGYYKNLVFNSKRMLTDTVYTADLNRVRTEWDAKLFKIFTAKLIWDNELIGGNYVNTEEFAARQISRNTPYLNMDYELVQKSNLFYGQNFYRAYAQIKPGPFTLTVGRQKIDWGVMRLFSPVDLFTRLPLLDVEKDERVGSTAANLIVPIGSVVRINPVYAFNPNFDLSRMGGRVTATLGHFDLSALGGRFLRDNIYGFDITGDIKKAGIRAEFILDQANGGDNFAQVAAGVDYGFENTFYFALEYFFNGQGSNSPLLSPILQAFPPTANQIKTLYKNFIGLETKYEPTPLWTVSMETLVDVNGGSVFFNPETKYSLLSWIEIASGIQIPIGKAGGEFTALPNVYYAQTKLFF